MTAWPTTASTTTAYNSTVHILTFILWK